VQPISRRIPARGPLRAAMDEGKARKPFMS
jgi:hypothetical protein